MKKGLILMLLVAILPARLNAQMLKPESDQLLAGVYYYPEHWPEAQWERDIKQIADLGFEFIHFAEFAWTRMQPAENTFDFEWLDKAIDHAGANGLKVILCTPSPCIPSWLSHKHPEILAVNDLGRRIYHNGSRLTASLASPVYRKYVQNIVQKLGKRYGADPRIWGWQIGNEPHIQSGYDFSEAARIAFIEWLKEKYGTVENLNNAWGAAFWSYTLTAFDEIQLPNQAIPGINPHALLDFQRYTSHEIARDLKDQANTLRGLVADNQWITTNYAYFKFLPNVDPFLAAESLDFSAHTMYLTSNRLNDSGDSLSHRLGSGMELAFSQELAESTHGYTGIMELQPGQINWGTYNAMPLPGAVRMWVWHAYALGDQFLCTYRFRQPLYGSEQFHHGIMMTDGVTVNRGGAEFVTAMEEIRKLKITNTSLEIPEYLKRTRTAFLFSFRNVLDMENYRHHEDWDSWQHIYTYYQALKRMGVSVDFMQKDSEFNPETHPYMVVPACQIMTKDLINKLQQYAEGGGHLVISTRSGMKDNNGHLYEAKLQEPISDLIGGQVQFYDHLPANRPGSVAFQANTYPWHTWGTVVQPADGTEKWGSFNDQFYRGAATVTHRSTGGSVTYVGTWSDSWEMEYDVLRKIYGETSGMKLFDLPPYVFVEHRNGSWITLNYSQEEIRLDSIHPQRLLIGEPTVPPGGVSVWK